MAIILSVGVLAIAAVTYGSFRFAHYLVGKNKFNEAYNSMEQRDYKKAITLFDAAANEPMDRIWKAACLVDRGYCYHWLGNHDKAMSDYTAGLQLNPDLAFALQERGLIYEAQNNPDLAAADFSQAVTLDPNLSLAWFHRGLYYKRKDNYESALADFRQAARCLPNYAGAYIEAGECSDYLKDREGALSSFEAALRINPKSASAYAARGRFYRRARQYNFAIVDLSEAILFAPRNKSYHFSRALTYFDQEKYAEAVADLTQVLKLDPRNESAWQWRGLAYRSAKDYEHAIDDYTELIGLTQSPDSYNDRARTYSLAGNYALALADYRRGGETPTSKVRTRSKPMAWFLATCPDESFRDGPKAVDMATKACNDDHWKDSSKLDTLAAAEAEVGNFDDAICYEKQALGVPNPDSVWKKKLEGRLALYQTHQPYRDTAGQ